MELMHWFQRVAILLTLWVPFGHAALHHHKGFQYVERPIELGDNGNDVIYTNDSVFLCDGVLCAKARFETLDALYPGVFHTAYKYSKMTDTPFYNVCCTLNSVEMGFNGSHSKLGVGDGGVACETRRYFCRLNCSEESRKAKNINGEECTILHLASGYPSDQKFQYVSKGTCGQSGMCKAKCVTEEYYVSLLAYNMVKKVLGFFLFKIPGYCTCRNIGN